MKENNLPSMADEEPNIQDQVAEIESWFSSLSKTKKMQAAQKLQKLQNESQTLLQEAVRQFEKEKEKLLEEYGLEEVYNVDRQYQFRNSIETEEKGSQDES